MGAGLAISLADNLSAVLIGILLLTIGFFGAHSISSGWVSARASRNRAGASSLYLLSYYLGSSVVGALGGIAFAHAGWNAMAVYVSTFLAIGAALTAVLAQTTRANLQCPR
jgi:predicted MFS family arabinose efflux permease